MSPAVPLVSANHAALPGAVSFAGDPVVVVLHLPTTRTALSPADAVELGWRLLQAGYTADAAEDGGFL